MVTNSRNPFVNQVGWFTLDFSGLTEADSRNPFVNQVGWFPKNREREIEEEK